MSNIFLTRKCNLKCPYCFADEFVNKNNEEITLENFKKAVEFIKTGDSKIGLIGGEPMLHPLFSEFLDMLISDDKIDSVIVFTNGLRIDKYINKLKHKKIHLLINCNSIKDIGEKNYEKLKYNLTILKNNDNVNIGINIYSKDMDYSYIFELLNIADKHFLRYATALPNISKEKTYDVLNSFLKIKPLLMKFFSDCLKNYIVPVTDCNTIPDCLLNIEDKRLMIKLNQLAMKYNEKFITGYTCEPIIDILPDLNAVRCFGLSKYMKASIEEHKNMENLRNYFINQIDLYARLSFVSKGCNDCKMRMLNRCGLCFTYKMKQCEKLKDYILDNSEVIDEVFKDKVTYTTLVSKDILDKLHNYNYKIIDNIYIEKRI